jgi:hypothetical protein
MQPSIRRSITTGFQVAHRSWTAMGLVIGLTVAIGLVTVLVIALGAMVTVAPDAQAQTEPADQATQPADAQAAAEPAALAEEAPAVEEPAALPDEPVESAEPADPFGAQPIPDPVTADTLDSLDPLAEDDAFFDDPAADDAAEFDPASAEALGRAWPVLLIAGLLFVIGLLAVEAGRLGYLAKRVRTGAASLADFWPACRRNYVPLLGAFGLTLLALLVFAPLWMVTAPLLEEASGARVLGFLLAGLEIAAWVWLTVRVGFWWIAVVADQLGPIKALRVSWNATRGRWLKTFGLWAALGGISLAASLPLFGLEALGQQAGGVGGSMLLVITSVGRLLLNTYLAFVVAAALIRYYDDTKTAS